MNETTDILIVGGGLAGSAAAIQLGRLGLSVELFERSQFPREKPCGEGLMPAGVDALDRLRLDRPPGSAPFVGIRYNIERQVTNGRFSPNAIPRVGRGYRRRDLDSAVFQTAKSTPGVTVHTGVRVEDPLIVDDRIWGLIVEGKPWRGRLVIAADGAQSRFRYQMGLDAGTRRKRIGMRAHFRLAPGQSQPQWVDIYVGRGFELYVTPLYGRELLVAALAHASALHGPIEDQYRRWWNSMPGLAMRLEGAEQISDLRATSPLSGRAKQGFLPGFVLLGDAAGFTDPITGSGMTQALLSAELLAQSAARGLNDFDRWLPEFDLGRKMLLRDCRRLASAVLWLADHPHWTVFMLAVLRRQPRLFSHLLGVSGSSQSLWGRELPIASSVRHRHSIQNSGVYENQ